MSSPSTLAFFGIRLPMASESPELALLEARRHPLQLAARKEGLDFYWGNFGEPAEEYLLFVGLNLGMVGPEAVPWIVLDIDNLKLKAGLASQKLVRIGLQQKPSLFVQWMPDA